MSTCPTTRRSAAASASGVTPETGKGSGAVRGRWRRGTVASGLLLASLVTGGGASGGSPQPWPPSDVAVHHAVIAGFCG
jgi:hypothetical protein